MEVDASDDLPAFDLPVPDPQGEHDPRVRAALLLADEDARSLRAQAKANAVVARFLSEPPLRQEAQAQAQAQSCNDKEILFQERRIPSGGIGSNLPNARPLGNIRQ